MASGAVSYTNLPYQSKPYTEIHVVNTKWEGEDAYATNDLFLPHPTLPGHWKLIGRKDDQLMLSTGEKVGSRFYSHRFGLNVAILDKPNPTW